jgi:hypothetical protein
MYALRRIVGPASFTSSAGTVTDSEPMNSHATRPIAGRRPAIPCGANGTRFSAEACGRRSALRTRRGSVFRIIVTTWTAPPARTPAMLTKVRVHSRPCATRNATRGSLAAGTKTTRYPTNPVTNAALLMIAEIQ